MKKVRGIVIISALVLLLICTFYDLQISMTLFNQSSNYGKFFEAVGELPMTFVGCFSAAALSVTTKKSSSWTSYFGKIGFGLLVLLFAFFSVMMVGSHVALSNTLKGILMIIISGVFYGLAKAVPAQHHEALRQAAKIGLFFALAAILVITILKMLWGRMRFRQMIDPASQFTRWYLPQSMTLDNEFMSFPSGHAANSTVILWISLLPTFVSPLAGKSRWLELAAFVWIILVMVSRIVMGAHFATDVIMGMLISVTLFFLLKKQFLSEKQRDMLS